MLSYIIAVVAAVLIIAIDQLSKLLIVNNFELLTCFPLIKGIFDFNYIHNSGAAWGMLSGKRGLLILITLVIMAVCIVWLINAAKKKERLSFWAVSLVLAGGVGNMVDRIFRGGKVVDFIQFAFWKSFPVFNIADCAIVIGCGLLILGFLLDAVKEARIKKEK